MPLRVRRSIRPAPRSWGVRTRSHHILHLPPDSRAGLPCSARTDGALEGLGPGAILVLGAGLGHVVERGEREGAAAPFINGEGWSPPQGCVPIKWKSGVVFPGCRDSKIQV